MSNPVNRDALIAYIEEKSGMNIPGWLQEVIMSCPAAVRNWAREKKAEKPPNKKPNGFDNFEPRRYAAADYAALARVGL